MILSDLTKAYPCRTSGELSRDITEIEYNSAKAIPGTLFFCLRGASSDGHKYAPDAYSRGCRAFVCDHDLDLPADAAQLVVDDTRAALPLISAEFFGNPAKKLKIIGITGTKGKTTTSLITSAILNAAGRPCAYIGSNGVMIRDRHIATVNTTPESRDLHHYFKLMVDAGIEYAAIEVSSQALARHRVDGISFDTAVFLNLSEDHIGEGEHPDFEDYRYSKSRLFSPEHDPAFVVFNADDPYSPGILEKTDAPRVSFSIKGNDADYTASDIRQYRDDYALGVSFTLDKPAKTDFSLRSPGEFSVANALAAVAVARHYGVSLASCADTLASTSVLGRCEIVEGLPGRTFILDYAHNGFSLTNTLTVLRRYDPERLICVFGSVGGRTKGRRAELAHASSALADYSIITSDNPDFEDPDAIIADIVAAYDGDAPYEIVTDREDAVREAVRMSEPGDIVLFAGKGHETYQIIRGEHVPFSEKEIIRDECSRLLTEVGGI